MRYVIRLNRKMAPPYVLHLYSNRLVTTGCLSRSSRLYFTYVTTTQQERTAMDFYQSQCHDTGSHFKALQIYISHLQFALGPAYMYIHMYAIWNQSIQAMVYFKPVASSSCAIAISHRHISWTLLHSVNASTIHTIYTKINCMKLSSQSASVMHVR